MNIDNSKKGLMKTMLKELDIDYYFDGFTVHDTNCIDNPIAGALGYFSRENYFYYSFYCSLYKNWPNINTLDFVSARGKILNKLGIANDYIDVDDDELINLIIDCINTKGPLVMIVKYNTVFYLPQYMTDDNSSHAIIINGYDDSKKLIYIKECMLHDNIAGKVVDSNPFFGLKITYDMLLTIWKDSNQIFKNEHNYFANKIISLHQTDTPKISSYSDLMHEFIDTYSPENNYLNKFIQDINDKFDYIKNEMDTLRKYVEGSMVVFFYVIEKAFPEAKKDSGYLKFKFKYMAYRKEFLVKAFADALRNKPYSMGEKDKFVKKNDSLDKELIVRIKHLMTVKTKKQNPQIGDSSIAILR